MGNNALAEKIRELRKQLGFSQEELAERTKLSLRTIQRIENGETTARGDTLSRLATGLNVEIGDLTEDEDQENHSFLALLNLSALSFLLFPLLGIIVPLVLWILKRDKIERVDESGKKILNFQISWSILRFITAGTLFHTFSLNIISPLNALSENIPFSPLLLLLVFAYLFNIIMVIYNMLRSLNGQPNI